MDEPQNVPFSVEEARLAEKLKEHRERKGEEINPSNAKITFRDAATLKLPQINDSVTIKRSTRKYWEETITSLKKSWPELFTTEIRRITPPPARIGRHATPRK